jgi:tryptophanyl-tRNA synthetase
MVPVGADQLPHLEFSRELARRFNNFYGEILIEPKAELTETAKIPGIDGRKMSKSYGNSIFLGEDETALKEKVNLMFTDPQKIKKNDPGHPEGCVVFSFYDIFNQYADNKKEQCKAGAIGCSQCKKEVFESLSCFMKPLCQKRKDILNDKHYLEKIIKEGNEKARQSASKTMKEIKAALRL